MMDVLMVALGLAFFALVRRLRHRLRSAVTGDAP